MGPRNRGGRPTLSQGLDREVYQVVRKIIDDQPDEARIRLSVPAIYEQLKKSNSSLNRKPKKLLEDSLERVLEVMKSEGLCGEDEADSVEGDFEGLEEPPVKEANGVNQSIVGAWATPKATTTSSRKTESGSSSKRKGTSGESSSKRRKAEAAVDRSPPTHVSLTDLGGLDDVVQELGDLVILPMTRPQVYLASNVQPPRGVLLHGPPGCGKTMIANAFAAELGVPFISISAPSIVSGMSGESEKALREHFDEAKRIAPCLIFIDEIDAITPKRESAQREMEKRIVAQLLTCMDEIALEKTDGKPVIVLAATNRPDSLDAALRRGGRFDKEINMTVPSEPVREQILRALTRKMRLADDLDLKTLAKRTPGFVGADLNDLVSTAGAAAIKRYLEILKSNSGEDMEMDMDMEVEGEGQDDIISPKVRELRRLITHAKETPIGEETNEISISNADFFTALPKIQPSSKREGFATVPDTTWSDIGALGGIRDELVTAIVEPIKNPDIYANVGITAPTGVLLWGPPGCGKTLLAKAVANESRANFISVKGPELLNKFVGESERAVRQVFVRARSSVPCVIFFDELDALVPRRDDTLSEASARVVNTLLTELDGLGSSRQGIYVIAATNRPDIIDPAMLRPGRLETLLFVNLPSPLERVDILQTLVRKLPIEFDESMRRLAEDLLRRAGYSAIKRRDSIKLEDFVAAKSFIRPSVTDMKKYEKLRRDWSGGVI
ncbi:AAA domain-containing protein [Penicillium cosmopolitanum]|uniref:AAA domain-containing protein n=1 Tax=Penicillium cosmopolitanum TaxID=1131564 RepID=A0A9W9WCU2_9EURO|nr:AAA domain-containing protein [Penicillium cosmopolitanum]KAJ5414824.1 AAA domain-containing protein [Penicillium cosmopolitanum]